MGDRNNEGLRDNSFRDGDPRFIDVSEPTERAYWCKVLGIRDQDLIVLVNTVGNSAQLVKDALRSSPPHRSGEG